MDDRPSRAGNGAGRQNPAYRPTHPPLDCLVEELDGRELPRPTHGEGVKRRGLRGVPLKCTSHPDSCVKVPDRVAVEPETRSCDRATIAPSQRRSARLGALGALGAFGVLGLSRI